MMDDPRTGWAEFLRPLLGLTDEEITPILRKVLLAHLAVGWNLEDAVEELNSLIELAHEQTTLLH